MPEENQSPQPSISQPLGKHSRNWKKILLILLIIGISLSLIGVGIYFYGSSDKNLSFKQVETKEPSETPKEHPLKNKIIYTKSFITEDFLDTDIYAMNSDGNGEMKIVDLEPQTNRNYSSNISLSPENKYLAWIRENADGVEKIDYIELDNYKQNTVNTLISTEGIKGFSFSPDEKKIAILLEDDLTSHGPISMVVRIYNFADKKLLGGFKPIAGNSTDDDRVFIGSKSLVWIDNSTVVTHGKNGNKKFIAKYDIEKGLNSEDRLIEPTSDYIKTILSITPSNKQIAYAIQKADSSPLDVKLWLININNKKKDVTTATSLGGNVQEVVFSPDGKYLAINSSEAEGVVFQIIDLTENKVLFSSHIALGPMAWSPNSKELLIHEGVYSSKLSIIGLDGKVVRELTDQVGNTNTVGDISSYRVIDWVR